MSPLGTASGMFLSAFAMAQGLWILVVRPDPPKGPVNDATRKVRQIAGIILVICGVFLSADFFSKI